MKPKGGTAKPSGKIGGPGQQKPNVGAKKVKKGKGGQRGS